MAAVPIPGRVAKMIPRLSSPHAGEVVATVAAIRRTLEGAGLTLFDLAAAVSPPVVGLAPPGQARQAGPQGESFTFARLSGAAALRAIAQIRRDALTDWEASFVESIAEQLRRRRPGRCLSAKQIATLDRLWRKVAGAWQ